MKTSLACVLNGHDWVYQYYNRKIYTCRYCEAWAAKLTFTYPFNGNRVDATEVQFTKRPNYEQGYRLEDEGSR